MSPTESKNSSQHNQAKKAHRNGSVARHPSLKTPSGFPCSLEPPRAKSGFNPLTTTKNKKAQDASVSVVERHRPEVPKKSQTRASRHYEGTQGGEGGGEFAL